MSSQPPSDYRERAKYESNQWLNTRIEDLTFGPLGLTVIPRGSIVQSVLVFDQRVDPNEGSTL